MDHGDRHRKNSTYVLRLLFESDMGLWLGERVRVEKKRRRRNYLRTDVSL